MPLGGRAAGQTVLPHYKNSLGAMSTLVVDMFPEESMARPGTRCKNKNLLWSQKPPRECNDVTVFQA